MNNKGWVWLVAAIPAAFAALLLAIDKLRTPVASPNSAAGIISSIPVYGWIVIGLIVLVLLKSR